MISTNMLHIGILRTPSLVVVAAATVVEVVEVAAAAVAGVVGTVVAVVVVVALIAHAISAAAINKLSATFILDNVISSDD